MLKHFVLLLCLGSLLGCAVLSKNGHSLQDGSSLGVKPVVAQPAVVPAVRKTPVTGLVFGKTDFRGLLKAAYARLTLVDRADPSRIYYFYVGSKNNQNILPWGKGEVIEPGYFFLQLTPGNYRVTAIAIPVGSTIAEEPLALGLQVSSDKAYYLGTLKVDGISERAKFGGVPLVQPGFEYSLAVDDEFDAARKDFERLSPRHDLPVSKKLFLVK